MNEIDPDNKTTVKAEFFIFADYFPLDEVSRILEMEPDSSSTKGDAIPGRPAHLRRIETSWGLETAYEESLCVANQLSKIIERLKDKKSELSQIKKLFSVKYVFCIVVCIREGFTPEFHLSRDELHFIDSIGAEVDIDLYAS